MPADTVTVVDAVTLPPELRAVSAYVVVTEGVTTLLPVPVTSPTELSIERLVAPETNQDNVDV